MTELHLVETKHPNHNARATFDSLVGLDAEKAQLVEELTLLLDRGRVEAWRKKHHPKGLAILRSLSHGAPLVVLAGEVGCGKSALASSVATVLADALDSNVLSMETPSDVRGSGLVGELSNRVTSVFSIAKGKITKSHPYGILIIDEADDLATSRTQLQAHHEDRAGMNVLVKQIDLLAREAPGLAVILITNRVAVLDPAIRRRVALHLEFRRPNKAARRAIFASILAGTNGLDRELDSLVKESEPKDTPYTSSDLIHRIARLALTRARTEDRPFSAELLREALASVAPTPLLGEAKIA